MKKLLAVISVAGLFGCAEEPQQITVANTHYPYSRYSTTTEAWGYPSKAYMTWTTVQLQKRRLELYAMVPQTQDRHGTPAYIYEGIPLRQQDGAERPRVVVRRLERVADLPESPERLQVRDQIADVGRRDEGRQRRLTDAAPSRIATILR